MKAYCVVLAGGTGSRMGGGIPKQFMLLKGVPVIVRTLRHVLACPRFAKTFVAIHPDWRETLANMMDQYGLERERVCLVDGGKERRDSFLNALAAIRSADGVNEGDVAVVAEAARPFATVEMLTECADLAMRYGASVAVSPVVDTMQEVVDGRVVAVPSRERLFHGQSPEGVRILEYERLVASMTPEARKTITGTTQVFVVNGRVVQSYPGSPTNIKITTPFDMAVAEVLCEKSDS